MYYPGIDLHGYESHVAVLDDDAEVVEEIRVTNANFDEVAEKYAGAKAALEANSNYYTVYDTLDEHLNVVVVDPSQTKAIGYAEVKTTGSTRSCVVQPRVEPAWSLKVMFRPKTYANAAHLCVAGSD